MALDASMFGLAGLVLIFIGWIPQTWDAVRRSKTNVRLEFAVLYAVGSASLALYSFYLNDLVFIALNLAATVMALINVYFNLARKRAKT